MSKTSYAGIDYSLGQANVDKETGIHYGVIPVHQVTQAWCDSSESDYSEPTCPDCGNEVVEYDEEKHKDYECGKSWRKHQFCDHACETCEKYYSSDDVLPDEPNAYYVDDSEYYATQSAGDCDIFIIKSPYYSKSQFCSPCAPGAGYLLNECDEGVKTYCLGHDWFEGDKAPYRVFRADNDEEVFPEKKEGVKP